MSDKSGAGASRPGFATLGLDHVVLRVADMDRALAFYCGVLGLKEERRVDRIGLVQLRAGAAMLDLVPAGDGGPGARGGNMDHFALRVAPWNPEAIRAHLSDNGYATGEPARRYGAEGEGWSIYLDDPDGNTVELKGPPA